MGFFKRLGEEAWDVVHYIGFSQKANRGIAFADDGGLESVLSDVEKVLTRLGERRPPLVIVQFMTLPPDEAQAPVPVTELLPLLQAGVQALVTTQHTVSDVHVDIFNRAFYGLLSDGACVEDAVQRARHTLFEEEPLRDPAGFGTFTVTTTSPGGVRLLTRTTSRPSGGSTPASSIAAQTGATR